MIETRLCAQCGTMFVPRREHARFCSARCRVAWNRQHVTAPVSGEGALDWSVAAMIETTDRLLRAKGWDLPPAYSVITESVWWVTMVDATLVRYRPGAYSDALARQETAERIRIEDTFGGLRFVRNRMGYEADHDDFIQPGRAARLARWTWKPVAEPALSLAVSACAGLGDDPLSGLPVRTRPPDHRRDLRAGSRLPQPH